MHILTKAATGSAEWLHHHQGKIGGAMAADILGCGRNTRKHAWATLTGRLREDLSKLPHIQMGIALEPVIASMWEQRLDRKLDPSPGLIAHDTLSWMVGTPDGIDRATGGAWEAKSVGFYRRRDWKRDIPLRVRVQAEWYSHLLGNQGPLFFAALSIPGSSDKDDTVDENDTLEADADDLLLWGQRDPDTAFQERAINEVGEFYARFVKTDTEPPAEGAKDIDIIKLIHPHDDRTVIDADRATWQRVLDWHELGQEISAKQKARKDLQAIWMDKMGDATWLKGPDGRFLRFKAEPRKQFISPACLRRIPRIMNAQRYS